MFKARVPFCMHRKGSLVLLVCLVIGIRIGGWVLGFPAAVLIVASLFLHEAGHMIAAISLKVPVREFGLRLGGTYVKRARSTRRRDEILIAASGPLMNLLLVVPFLFVPRFGIQLATCNLVLGFVNLLPLPSSDGLRILRNLMSVVGYGEGTVALSATAES